MRLTLYSADTCPHCQRVLRAIDDLNVEVEVRDVLADPALRGELREALGRGTVPVLRIDDGEQTRWLPESQAIVAWLYESKGQSPPRGPNLRQLATFTMWAIVVVALFFPEHQAPLFVAALSLGAARSAANAWIARSWLHLAVASAFVAGAAAVLLQHLGLARIPWWYGVYALVGSVLLGGVVLRMASRRQRS